MTLNFDDELGARHFEFVFVGFVLGGSLQAKKGLSLLRVEVGLFDKLEQISEPRPCGKKLVNGEPERRLAADGPKHLAVTPQEYDLIYTYVAEVPWQSGTPSKQALETIEWLERTRHSNGG